MLVCLLCRTTGRNVWQTHVIYYVHAPINTQTPNLGGHHELSCLHSLVFVRVCAIPLNQSKMSNCWASTHTHRHLNKMQSEIKDEHISLIEVLPTKFNFFHHQPVLEVCGKGDKRVKSATALHLVRLTLLPLKWSRRGSYFSSSTWWKPVSALSRKQKSKLT